MREPEVVPGSTVGENGIAEVLSPLMREPECCARPALRRECRVAGWEAQLCAGRRNDSVRGGVLEPPPIPYIILVKDSLGNMQHDV